MKLTQNEIGKVERIYKKGFTYKVSEDSLRIYDGREISPFAREFFSRAFVCVPEMYGQRHEIGVWELKTDAIKEPGIIVSKNMDKLYRDMPGLWLDEKKAKKYIKDTQDIRSEFEHALFIKDYPQIYDLAIKHLAFYADSFFPEEELVKAIGAPISPVIFTPDYSSYQDLHHGLLDVAERVHFGEKPELSKFAEDFGFLAGDDIVRSSYETAEGILEHLEKYVRIYSLDDIMKDKEERRFRDIVTKCNREEYIKTLPRNKKVHHLCSLAKDVANYNEYNRKLVKKAFQVLRNFFEEQGVDYRTGNRDLVSKLYSKRPVFGYA